MGCKFMGVLALAQAGVLDVREVIERVQGRFPSYPGPPLEAGEADAADRVRDGGCQIRIGAMLAVIGVIPAPIFPTVLEPAIRAATDWADAQRQLSRSTAQLIVEVISPTAETIAARLDAARITVMLCSALADLSSCLGIYWKSGGVITEPGRFQERADQILSDDLPFDLWIQFSQPKGSWQVSTTGLRDFLGREMEFEAAKLSPEELRSRVYAAARCLIANADYLRHNERIYYDDDEDIWPNALIEGVQEDIPVWALIFEKCRAAAGRPDPRSVPMPFSGVQAPANVTGPAHTAPGGGPSGGDSSRRTIQMPSGRPGGDKQELGSFTAFLALESPVFPSAPQLFDHMGKRFPQLQSKIVSTVKEGEAQEAGAPLVFFMGDSMIMVIFIDQPMPPGTLTIPARASRGWPEAEADLAAHRAHAIVHASAKNKTWSGALTAAQNVSVVSAALADLSRTIGVYWSEGWLVTKPDEFIRGTEHILAGKYSGADWFQFWFLGGPPTVKGEPTMAVLTTGLEPFFGKEIEFLPAALPPATIVHRLLGVIEYLLTHGLVFNEGDTLGGSYEEAIRIRYADQGQRPGIPVIQLTLEKIDANISPSTGGPAGKPAPDTSGRPPAVAHGGTGAGDNLAKFTTYIPLKRVSSIEEDTFNECLRARFPNLHAQVTSGWRTADVSAFGERIAFDMDGHEVGIMFVNRPSRPDMLAPALRAGSAWREAEQELSGHQGCAIVHVDPLGDDWAAALNSARIVTGVSAVLAELLPAIGVVWSEGETLTRAADFVASAPRVMAGQYGSANWFRHWLAFDPDLPEGKRTIAMGTIGLSPFIGREIEFAPAIVDPGVMAKRLRGIIQYVLTNGPVLKDGAALRSGETLRVRIRHADQGKIPGIPVYLLTLEDGAQNGTSSGKMEKPPATPTPLPPGPASIEPSVERGAADGPGEPNEEGSPNRSKKPLFGRRGLD